MARGAVSIIGLGKLGSSMAAAMASRGLHVIGVDVVPRSVELLNQGKPPIQETHSPRLLASPSERLHIGTPAAKARARTSPAAAWGSLPHLRHPIQS